MRSAFTSHATTLGGLPSDIAASVAPLNARTLVTIGALAMQDRLDLEAAGFRVLEVDETGAPALVETVAPDLVVYTSLSETESTDIFRAIRQRRHVTCAVIVPATTGVWMTAAHRSDADAVLCAPLDPAAVGRLIGSTPKPAGPGPTPVFIDLPELIDTGEEMRAVWRLVAVAAHSDSSVIVTGETGVGKEVVAQALHRFSPRRSGPFVAVNCAAIPETLLESELFGHEKGSFTGATSQRKGRFELANGGTLFLDEVGDLPFNLQVKLLRVLQEREFERVGGSSTISVDVRVISATHRNLEEEVRRGRFRADLYYRINVLSIHVPPLRSRRRDILPMFEHFIGKAAARERRTPPIASAAAQRRLLRHPWPGNVRELQNVAQHTLMMTAGTVILPADLPVRVSAPDQPDVPEASFVGKTLREIECEAILGTYEALGTIRGAAEVLGVSERKIHYRLKEYRQEGRIPSRTGPQVQGADAPDLIMAAGPRVLLAEDDDELRWALAEFLEGSGYRVYAVRDGRALLEHLGAAMLFEKRDAPPDVIIADIRMPCLSGMQLLENVKGCGWATPVVVMSAFGDDDARKRAASLGAAAFLDKPIDTDHLQRILREVVEPGMYAASQQAR